jgi:hypothetical protein
MRGGSSNGRWRILPLTPGEVGDFETLYSLSVGSYEGLEKGRNFEQSFLG